MNYYQARQRKDNGKWCFTWRNDNQFFTHPCCHDHEGHDTPEEADKCFYEYEIKELREAKYNNWEPCLICKQEGVEPPQSLTNKTLESRNIGMAFLCDKHRNEENFRKVHPFEPGIEIIASW